MSDIFRALADDSRRQLLDRLRDRNGQTLTQLCDGLAMSRQAVSKHLGVLQDANLIAVRRSGREKLHFLNPVPLAQIVRRWIGKFEEVKLLELCEAQAPRHDGSPALQERNKQPVQAARMPS
ncbi:ArsR/SmtB family transcription factor [Sphingomonas cavernae]|uniref:ArsR family transcriptional regulator n=1 Tax=Sphingomonas cavernae TaxID=2320861 RepID=A0A418WK07_9SPHN|nr:metalloregulator ArsR/SmtB family transcription factor [Sphingomonas cavernae]RJF90371.1 ArsR family transcriptional regulator [Sphingomonas cavernae]